MTGQNQYGVICGSPNCRRPLQFPDRQQRDDWARIHHKRTGHPITRLIGPDQPPPYHPGLLDLAELIIAATQR